MKSLPRLFAFAVATAMVAQTAPVLSSEPTGTLSVNTDLVRSGVKPQVTWNVVYPEIPFTDPEVTEDVTLYVSVFGIGLEGKNNNGHGNNEDDVDSSNRGNRDVVDESGSYDDERLEQFKAVPVTAALEVDGVRYDFFSGTSDEVDASEVLLKLEVEAGSTLEFLASGSDWGERSSIGEHIVVLKDGDTPPDYAPAYGDGDIISFLQPYVNEDGTIDIGPNDILYIAELERDDPGNHWYDMQDIVVHVRFEQTTTTE